MTRPREILFQILTLLTFGLVIYVSWGSKILPTFTTAPENQELPASTSQATSLSQTVSALQVKLLIGGVKYAEREGLAQVRNEATKLFSSSIDTTLSNPDKLDPVTLTHFLLAAHYLGLEAEVKALSNGLKSLPPENENVTLLLTYALGATSLGEELELSSNELAFVEQTFGWSGLLLKSMTETDQETKHSIEARIEAEAIRSFEKAVLGIALMMLVGVLSPIALVILLFQQLRGKLVWRFSATGAHPGFALEIFCLYLLGMLALPSLLGQVLSPATKAETLKLNVIGISCLAILIFWPVYFGENFRSVTAALGLQLGGFRQFVKDLFLAPFSYVASLSVFIALIVAYSLVLQSFDVNTEEGAHPVVPILISSDDSSVTFWIVLLAVIVAPIIEEIMFRGALYNWLRSHLGICAAVVSSSLAFSVVHPQGLIGIFPLTLIGCVLALLREWRGSLIAPIVAHACFNGGTLTLLFLFFS